MPATVDTDHDLATRRLYITTRLAGQLADELEELERQLREGPLERDRLRGRVDDLLRLAFTIHDELRELDVP